MTERKCFIINLEMKWLRCHAFGMEFNFLKREADGEIGEKQIFFESRSQCSFVRLVDLY